MSTRRRLTRRAFLKTAGLTAAGAALAGYTPLVTRQLTPMAEAARALKTVRFAMSGKVSTKDTADPAFNTSQHDGRLISAVYEQLARYDESLRAQPWLAESWQPNARGDVWTFKLRPRVAFHDGSRLTARDVVYSFRRLMNKATASPGAGNMSFMDPDGITAVDDRTVRFRLKQPNVDLPLTLIFRQAYIVKQGASSADLKTKANGTGAFRLRQFTPGESPTIFVRNQRYWQRSTPKIDVLELSSVSEAASRVAALQRRQVDVIEDVPIPDVNKLKAGPGTKIAVQAKGNMELIAMQIDVPPFTDNRVRLAMKYAMDRQKMLRLVAGGFGTLVNDIPIASSLEYGLAGPPRPHDVAKAKQLLAEAGHPNGITVKLSVSDVQARFMEFATVFKETVAEAGIRVELDVRPADTYWDVVWLKAPMYVSAYIARPTDGMLALLYLSTADWNETHWRKAEWDALFAKARGTLSYDQRKAAYQQVQQQLVDQGGHLVPYMVNTIDATRTNVTGWKPSGTPYHDFANLDITG